VKLGTSSFGEVRVRLRVREQIGFAPVRPKVLSAKLLAPKLRYGSTGPGVVELVRRLDVLRYAVRRTSVFGSELVDSVIAFQKVQGLERNGEVDAHVWRRLAHPRIPSPRYPTPGDHIEINKSKQVLFIVRSGKITTIIPVSTAGIPGWYTPEGRFAIYRKVPGFDPSPLGTLYAPMYFTGGYAIHGNPSVPPYPASHGCIRVPMWIADWLYATNGYGETVYVYS
jgi:peptidoglycan hydrolase-like protein with peptidoglycan-binding domain